MKPLALIVALVAFSTPAFAEGVFQDDKELRLVQSISVGVQDFVVDGCLPNPNALKAEAKLTIQESGIRVGDSGYQLSIVLQGREPAYESGEGAGLCIVRLDVDLLRWATVQEGHISLVIAYKKVGLFDAKKAEMQELLQKSVSFFVTDLANEILKARGQ